MAEGEGRWSVWYNRDRPWIGQGDFETVELIEQNFGPICPRGQEVVSSVCQLTRFMEEFTESTAARLDDHLQFPCSPSNGLLCLNSQQNPDKMCNDYAIKFLCKESKDTVDDESSPFPQFDVRIYIILAVVPIFIFLVRILWAYVFRRRRQQRRAADRARRRRGGGADRDGYDDDNGSVTSALANPPPSYKELFGDTGQNRSSVFAISGRNIPICEHCKEKTCSVFAAMNNQTDDIITPNASEVSRSISNSSSQILSAEASTSDSFVPNLDNASNLTNSPSSSSSSSSGTLNDLNTKSISIPSVCVDFDHHAISTEHNATQHTDSQQSTGSSGASPSSDVLPSPSHVIIEDEVNGSNNSLSKDNNNSSSNNSRSNNNNSSSRNNDDDDETAHRTEPILTPLTLKSEHVPCGPSPSDISDPCACTCHRTIPHKGRGVVGYENPGFHHENPSQTMNPPGMHVPLPGLHRVWSNLSTGSTITLSELPTYQDALEIIKQKEAEAMQNSN